MFEFERLLRTLIQEIERRRERWMRERAAIRVLRDARRDARTAAGRSGGPRARPARVRRGVGRSRAIDGA